MNPKNQYQNFLRFKFNLIFFTELYRKIFFYADYLKNKTLIFIMKLLTRFYSKLLPDEGDMVLGKVIKFDNYGIQVLLQEYNNLEAFLNYRDASGSKKIKNIKKQIKLNKSYPFTVISVDEDKNFVDLSKRYQEKEDEEKFNEYHNKYRKCMLVASNSFRKFKLDTVEKQNEFLSSTIWNYDRFKIYDILHKIKKNGDYDNDSLFNLDKVRRKSFCEVICNTLPDYKFYTRFNIRVNSLGVNGKNDIIEYLKLINNELNCNVVVKNIPVYSFEIRNILDKDLDETVKNTKTVLNNISKNSVIVEILDNEIYKQ